MATPLKPDALLAALRSHGARVQEVGNWRTHSRNHKGSWGPVHGIMLHYTAAMPNSTSADPTYNRNILYGGYSGLPGPLCTVGIGRDGTVYLNSAGRANHAGKINKTALDLLIAGKLPLDKTYYPGGDSIDGNARLYGIECINTGRPTEQQLDAAAKVCAGICKAHGWTGVDVISHGEATRRKTNDPPGVNMGHFRQRVRGLVSGTSAVPPTPAPEPPKKETTVGLKEHFVTGQTTDSGDWVLGIGCRDTGGSTVIRNALQGLYVKRKFTFQKPAVAGRSLNRKDLVNLRDFAHAEGIPWKGGLTWPLCAALAKKKRYLDVRWFNSGNPIDVRYGEFALFFLGHLRWGWWMYDGKLGTETTAAIKKFQKSLGDTQDGKLGPKQWAKLAEKSGLFDAPGMSSSGGGGSTTSGGRVSSPVPGRGIGTPYGKRGRHWSTRRDWRGWGIHTGDDYPAPLGTGVVAVRNGTVSAFWGGSLGNVAVLAADNGRFYWYCHLQTGSRKTGRVKAGEVIGRVGLTGNTTGAHLHFEDNPSRRTWGNPRKPSW